jgi:hypothetical protein
MNFVSRNVTRPEPAKQNGEKRRARPGDFIPSSAAVPADLGGWKPAQWGGRNAKKGAVVTVDGVAVKAMVNAIRASIASRLTSSFSLSSCGEKQVGQHWRKCAP